MCLFTSDIFYYWECLLEIERTSQVRIFSMNVVTHTILCYILDCDYYISAFVGLKAYQHIGIIHRYSTYSTQRKLTICIIRSCLLKRFAWRQIKSYDELWKLFKMQLLFTLFNPLFCLGTRNSTHWGKTHNPKLQNFTILIPLLSV